MDDVRRRILFALEGWLLRGALFRFGVLAAMLVAIALVFGTLAWAIGPIDSWSEGVWWAALHLSDSGYWGDDEGPALRILGAATTILGVVVFVGTLIAVMTQWLLGAIERVESGRTPVRFRDHIVVLGWSSRTAVVVRELLSGSDRVARFLLRRGIRRVRIVVLADTPAPQVVQELSERLGSVWHPGQVVVRRGSPLRARHLHRASVSTAAVVLVPAGDGRIESEVDARTFKALLSASNGVAPLPFERRPLVVVEMVERDKAALAERAYDGPVEVIASDVIVGRLLVQAASHSGIGAAYAELLGHEQGCEVYVRSVPEGLVGARYVDASCWFPSCTPIGLVTERGRAELLPDAERAVELGDELVVIAADYVGATPSEIATADPWPTVASDAAPPRAAPRKVLLLGWSRKVADILESLGAAGGGDEVTVVSLVPEEERHLDLETRQRVGSLRHIEGDFAAEAEMRRVAPESFDAVILLASDWLAGEQESDARTLLGCLVLREVLGEASTPTVVVELLDASNRPLLADLAVDVVVTSEMVSRMVAHVGMRPRLAPVYGGLLGPGGAEFAVRRADVWDLEGPQSVRALRTVAAAHGEVLVGVRIEGEGTHRLNPPIDDEVVLGASDALLTLAQSVRASARVTLPDSG